MSTFSYTAIDRQGRRTSGTVPAESRAAAMDAVLGRGLSPITVTEATGKAGAPAAGGAKRFSFGSSTKVSRRDAEGNTYQMRPLPSGEEYEVLKNFPTAVELADAVRPVAREAHLEELTYYWLLVFTVR